MHDTRRVRLVLGILLIAAVALITIDFRDGGTSPARGVGSSVFGPVERVASDVTSPVSSVFDWVTGGPSADSKIASLQAANAKLRADLSAAQLSKADESQLSSLLKLAGRDHAGRHDLVTALARQPQQRGQLGLVGPAELSLAQLSAELGVGRLQRGDLAG